MSMAKVFVNAPQQLTRAWAQRVLSAHAGNVEVLSCERTKFDIGTTSRVWLDVDHDGPIELARRWFVKLPSASWKARAITTLARLPQTEVRFYRQLSRRVRVPHPRALAAQSRWGRGFMLVLADVTEAGAQPGTPRDSLTAGQAGLMVDLLSNLHASHWQHPDLDASLAWLGSPVRRLEGRLGSALAVPLMRRGLAQAAEAVSASLHADAIAYASRRSAVHDFLGAGPRTLVHHDCHPGNVYWFDGKPGLLDWQLVRIGEGVGDLAYLLGTALQPELRRKVEDDLLARYQTGLRRGGVAAQDLRGLRDRYRAHMTYVLEALVVTLAVGGLMDDDVAKELCRRAACAAADLDAFAVCTAGMKRLHC